MLNKNATCLIFKLANHSLYGEPAVSPTGVKEDCAIVRLRKEMKHTTVRADSSQSRGHGDEFTSTTMVLLDGETVASLGDKLVVAGFNIKITTMHPRFDVRGGEVDHWEVTGELWE